jgi:N-methylhydantoinase A
VIEEATTNILIRPGWVVELHESGCYRLTRQR